MFDELGSPPAASAGLEGWLADEGAQGKLGEVVLAFADAAIEIAAVLRHAPATGQDQAAGRVNVQGEDQKELDVISHDIAMDRLRDLPQIAGMVSEEVEAMIVPDGADPSAPFYVCFDPLDGSSNLEINGSVGTIFSVLRRRDAHADVDETDLLASSFAQVAAGYVLYGPATVLVVTTGQGVAMFTLDERSTGFVQSHAEFTIPASAAEYAINAGHARHWEPEVAAYIADCNEGSAGPRGKDFNMRWAGAMVADMHRLFVRGGIFIYPALTRPGGENGKLRFLYEANPMALLVEAAGGRAIARGEPLRGIAPTSIHQRVPVALGSRNEVERLAGKYRQASAL